MRETRKPSSYNENNPVTIIGQGTKIKGELYSKGTVRIEGVVTGRIECDDTIVVLETGKIKADLLAGQVIIGGEVHGNVMARDRLEIAASGKVLGDITAPRISIAEGVLFEGTCSMKAPEEPGKPAAQPAAQQPAAAPTQPPAS